MVTTGIVGRIDHTNLITAADGEFKEQQRLLKACEDFEAFLLSYLLRQMWQAAEAVGGEKPFASQAYRDLFTFEFAQCLVPSMRLHIAESLYHELAEKASSEASLVDGSAGDLSFSAKFPAKS